MQKPIEGQVVVGVDTHKEIHVAAAVDWRGTLVDEKSFATTRQGYRQLESWARSLGDVLRVGVECSGSYGSGLTRHLAKNGFTVLEVTFPDKTVRRKRGKDDFIDAEMAAEAAFTGTRTVTPKARDGMVESLRMLQKTRSTAVAARRSALQMIRAIIISAPEELRDQLRGMTRMQLIRHLVATRPDSTDFKSPTGSARIALKRLAKRYVDLDDEIDELDEKNVRIRILGDKDGMPEKQRAALYNAEERTKDNTGLNLNIAINYGGRAELARAAQALAAKAVRGEIKPEDIDEAAFANELYTKGQPDVDLLIRTSGEMRLSNFLLFQCAYAEFEFPTVLWPDFDLAAYHEALDAFRHRDRRFGGRNS